MIALLFAAFFLASPARAAVARVEIEAPAGLVPAAPSALAVGAAAPLTGSSPPIMTAPALAAAPLAAPSISPSPLAAELSAPALVLPALTAPAALPALPAASAPVGKPKSAPEAAAAPPYQSRIGKWLARLVNPFGTRSTEEAPPASEAERLDRDFAKLDLWSSVGPAAKTEISGLRARKLSKAQIKEYVRGEVNAAFERVKLARGTGNIGLHYNLHGGRRADYVGAGIRASKGDIALRYSMSADANDKVYFFQTAAHDAYTALDASNGEILFFPSRMGFALSAFAVDAPELKAALADGRIANMGSISMDFHKGMRGVPYSAYLAPPVDIFVRTAKKVGLGKLSRDEETLATARYLEAALTYGGSFIPGGAPLSPAARAALAPKSDPRLTEMRADPDLRASLDDWNERKPLFAARAGYRFRRAWFRLRSFFSPSGEGLLPDAERDAIRMYCGFLYHQLNRFLRGSESPASSVRARALNALASLIVSGLDKLPDYRGTAYRYLRTDDPGIPARYAVGETVREDGFTSATRRGKRLLMPGAGATSVKFVIESLTGKSVERLSFNPAEGEVLFKPGARFLVTGKTETTANVAGRPHQEFVIRLREL